MNHGPCDVLIATNIFYRTSRSVITAYGKIDPELLNSGVEKENEEIRKVHLRFYYNSLYIGLALLFAGVANFVLGILSIKGGFNIDCISVILVIFGFGQIVYAVNGIFRDRK